MVTWERKFCWPEEMGQGAKERWGNKPFPLPCSWRTVCSHHLSSFTIDCLCIFTPTLMWIPWGQYWTLFILISPNPGESLAPLGHHPSLRDPTDRVVGVELCCPGVPAKQVLSEGGQRMVLLLSASFQEVPGHTWHPLPVNSQGISPPAPNPTTFSSQFYIPGWRLSLELFTPMVDFPFSILEVTWSNDVITYFGQNKSNYFQNKISLFTQCGSESCSVESDSLQPHGL